MSLRALFCFCRWVLPCKWVAEIAFWENRHKFSNFPDKLDYLPTFGIWCTCETAQDCGVFGVWA